MKVRVCTLVLKNARRRKISFGIKQKENAAIERKMEYAPLPKKMNQHLAII